MTDRDNPVETTRGGTGSRPSSTDEREELARKQGELISSGRARKGHIVLRTPARKAVFIGGLAGIVLLALVLAIAG